MLSFHMGTKQENSRITRPVPGLQRVFMANGDWSPTVSADLHGGAAERLEPIVPAVPSAKNGTAERASQRNRLEALNKSSRHLARRPAGGIGLSSAARTRSLPSGPGVSTGFEKSDAHNRAAVRVGLKLRRSSAAASQRAPKATTRPGPNPTFLSYAGSVDDAPGDALASCAFSACALGRGSELRLGDVSSVPPRYRPAPHPWQPVRSRRLQPLAG